MTKAKALVLENNGGTILVLTSRQTQALEALLSDVSTDNALERNTAHEIIAALEEAGFVG